MSSSIDSLPNEILKLIFAKLDLRDRLAARSVCKRWNSVMDGTADFLHDPGVAPTELLRHEEMRTSACFDLEGEIAVFITEMPRGAARRRRRDTGDTDDDIFEIDDVELEERIDNLLEIVHNGPEADGVGENVMEISCFRGDREVCKVVRTSPGLSTSSGHDRDIFGHHPPLPVERYCSISWRRFVLFHGTCEIFRIDQEDLVKVTCLGKLMFGGHTVRPTRAYSNSDFMAVATGTLRERLLLLAESADKLGLEISKTFEVNLTEQLWAFPLSTDVFNSSEIDKHLGAWAVDCGGTYAVMAGPDNR